jgi:hypothetical protein
MKKPWWKYIVIRGFDIPADIDGRWYEFHFNPYADDDFFRIQHPDYRVTFVPTNQWEQREDGEVAVVYRRFR